MTKTITSGQRKQIVRFCEDGLGNTSIDKRVAQRMIEKGDEFQKALVVLINQLGELPYANEEVVSNYSYPQGFRDRNADEQITSLREFFPKLIFSDEVMNRFGESLLEGAESKKVIPDYREVALCAKSDLTDLTEIEVYCLALNVVVERLQNFHGKKFCNYREGALTPKHLKLLEKTISAHTTLRETQGGIWVVDSQFGIRHRGKSVRRARVVFTEAEFGLGAYEIAILLLTHHDRIQSNDLNIDCAGVEYSPSADGDFFACLDFKWDVSFYQLLALNYVRTVNTSVQWGSASAFLPQ